jgi:hypothetical protein
MLRGIRLERKRLGFNRAVHEYVGVEAVYGHRTKN